MTTFFTHITDGFSKHAVVVSFELWNDFSPDPRLTSIVDRLNTTLAGRYTIERELGAGGMVTVYLAHDATHDRRVALTVLRAELAQALGPERVLREIKIAAQLEYPNISMLIDSGDADGLLYYVMPFVDGESLRDRMAREGQLPLGDALRLAAQVADALAYAHAQGVVHRDRRQSVLPGRRRRPFPLGAGVRGRDRGPARETGAAMSKAMHIHAVSSAMTTATEGRIDGRNG